MVRFDNVSLHYSDAGGDVLKDLSFRLAEGSLHFLTGPSGAGKTSLLKLLYLALRPNRGRIFLFGKEVTRAPRRAQPALRRRIGVVFQDFRLIDHLSVLDNVSLPLRIAGLKPADYGEDVTELLDWVGLGDRLDAAPASLSGGEKQRVAIARAVIAKPDLLLADEPTGNVDPVVGLRLMRLFVELNKLGTTVLIATHDSNLIERFGAGVMTLNNGQLLVPDSARPDNGLAGKALSAAAS